MPVSRAEKPLEQRGRGFGDAKRYLPKTILSSSSSSSSSPSSSSSSSSSSSLSSSSSSRGRDSDAQKRVPTKFADSLRSTPGLPFESSSARIGDESCGFFVNYLPQDEAVASGLGVEEGGLDAVESQAVVDVLNAELSRLLKMNARQFWEAVLRSSSLQEFLDSYLRFRNRWYDLPHRGPKGMIAGVVIGEAELSRRVFMVLYRLSFCKDPGANFNDSLNSREHSALLQEKKWLELPKLMDICAIFGHDNAELTRALVTNAIRSQPNIVCDISSAVSYFLSIIHTMHQRCTSSLEVFLTSAPEACGEDRFQKELLEVMDFINDSIVTMDSFVDAYRPAATYLSSPYEISHGNEELLYVLARLHDSLVPLFQLGFMRLSSLERSVFPGLKLLYLRIAKFGWNLLDTCYLSDDKFGEGLDVQMTTKILPVMVEDPMIRGDILVQTLGKVNAEISGYTHDIEGHETFLQRIERKYGLLPRISSLRSKGWIFLDDNQFCYISGIAASSSPMYMEKGQSKPPVSSDSNDLQADEDAAIMESKISQVKDLFPDYGRGFIVACLEVYDNNPEEVIQRILEETLHADLLHLDRSTKEVNLSRSKHRVTGSKGKEVVTLTEYRPSSSSLSSSSPLPPQAPAAVIAQHSSSSSQGTAAVMGQPSSSSSSSQGAPIVVGQSSSSRGKFIRKTNDESPDSEILDSRAAKDSVRAVVIEAQYEDEYDDSFDDLGLSVGETGFEAADPAGNRVRSLPEKALTSGGSSSRWQVQSQPQYYVKDGKNYSYKVAGSVAAVNAEEAALVRQAQRETIYGLGRGGNLPLGAVKKIIESEEQVDDGSESVVGSGPGRGHPRGRGGRRGGSAGHHRKDRALRKVFAGLT
ncbi:ubiquitin system component Cue protein [Wolffia australiana]